MARELRLQGKSRREVAMELWQVSSRESTLRSWESKGLLDEDEDEGVGLVEESVVVEEDTLDENTLDSLCESTNWSVSNLAKRLRSAQRSNNQLRKVQREMFDSSESGEAPSIEDIMVSAATRVKTLKAPTYNYAPESSSEPSTLEVNISDLQIGKVSRYYNTEIAKEALKMHGEGILQAMEERKAKFEVERIIVNMLGDLVEDNIKHGVGSAIACDTGHAEQIHDAIEGIWQSILKPLALLGIPMDVTCIVGNHSSSTHKGMGTFKEGKFSYDYIVHKTLESFCKMSGYDWVKFNIPEGVFGVVEVYGKYMITEHGYKNACSEKGMVDQMRKRGAQLQIHPTYWRQGDKHHHACFGQGEQILNGAYFGVDTEGLEYSGILGFNSVPSQTIVFHTDDQRLGYTTAKDIINIQLAVTE